MAVATRDQMPIAVVGATNAARLPSAAASVNATLVRAGAGRVYQINGVNAASGATVVYIKLYDKATAPVVGTDVPVYTLACDGNKPFQFDLGGFQFALGIGYGLTTAAADNGTTALTAGDILGLNIAYA
jgi:hypothetical protein